MPSSDAPARSFAVRRSWLVDTTPLRRSRPFARLWGGSLLSGFGVQLTVVAVGFQVYDLTRSTFAVAMVGVVGLLPLVLAGLAGGALTDAFDRRRVLLAFSLLAWASTLGLVAFAVTGSRVLWLLYALTTLNSIGGAAVSVARNAVIPQLLTPAELPAAGALNGIAIGLAVTAGPAAGGALVAIAGFGWTYAGDAVLFLSALAAAATLPPLVPEGDRQRPGLASIRAGLAFLARAPVIRTSFVVDLAAMTLGRPNALLPAVGATVIGGGAATAGLLTTALAVGALGLGLGSGRLITLPRQGLVVGLAIAVYGAGIVGFGVVLLVTGDRGPHAALLPGALAAAAACLVVCGASDETSAVLRTVILQTAAPDAMRGRLQGIFTVVVNGGPRLGDLFVGVLGTAGALWLPPIAGGAALVVVVALILRGSTAFRDYRGAA